MSLSKIIWLKRIVFLACLAPALWLAWKWYQDDLGINRIEYVARYTGHWTLRLLLATLAITPLRRIPGLRSLIQVRRTVGLFTFFYGLGHGLHYFAVDAQWDLLVLSEDITYRRFFIAGAIALLLMAPLAATSFTRAIRWMGGRRWQLLHRLIYPSAIAAIVHYLWQAKGINLTPLYYAGVLALLLSWRMGFFALNRFRKRR